VSEFYDMSENHGVMIGFKDAVDFFENVGRIIDDNDVDVDRNFPEKFTRAMNRLRYECDHATKAYKVNRLQRLSGKGCFERCGNCYSEAIQHNPQYNYCPNCGYKIDRT